MICHSNVEPDLCSVPRSWQVQNSVPKLGYMQWDNYRYAVEGYCIRGGLSSLLETDYMPSPDQKDQELQEKLMGILLQTNRDMAGVVVRPFARKRDGVGAWSSHYQVW